MMKKWMILLAIWGGVCAWCVSAMAEDKGTPEPRLQRTVTVPFPADFRGFEPISQVALMRDGRPAAAIVRADTGALRGEEEALRAEIRRCWGVDLPVMSADEALKAKLTLVLFGENRSNMPLRRLVEVCAVESVQDPRHYEARIYPQLLDYPAGVLYFGGRTIDRVLAGVRAAAQAHPDASRLPFFIECERERGHRPDPAVVQEMVDKVRLHLTEPDSWIPNQTVIRLFRDAFARFLATGCREYAEAVAAMQKLYLENYQKNIKRFDASGPAPSFLFHEYVWKLEIVAVSPWFTPEDRARSAELMRQVAENCFDYYEMRLPMKDYAAGEANYQTNHEIFCSRTVYFIAEYLLRHYQYEPARYWMAVAANALSGVAKQPISPEDAAAYQYLNYQIFTSYVMASGRFDLSFFQTEVYRNYIRYCKAQYNHLGFTAAYGDNPALGNAWSFPALGTEYSVSGDPEAGALLSLIARTTPFGSFRSMIRALNVPDDLPFEMSDDLVGLAVFPVGDFILAYNKGDGLFDRPVLDKAFFRGSWQKDADFLAFSGLSAAPHGHYDANAVVQYVDGAHLWLVDGDYLRKYPEEHNTLHLSRNGQSHFGVGRDRSRFARLDSHGMTPDRKMAALAATVTDWNGTEWTRYIGFAAGNGFWALDRVRFLEPGEYQLDCRWRLLGEAMPVNDQTVAYQQRPADDSDRRLRLTITGGGEAWRLLHTKFDTGHSGENGYYATYPWADKYTRNWVARRRGTFAPGEETVMVHYLKPGTTDAPVPELFRIGDRAWLLRDGGELRLAVLGRLSAGEVEIEADYCFAGPEGVVAGNPKKLRFGDWMPELNGAAVTAIPNSAAIRAGLQALAPLATADQRTTFQPLPEVDVPVAAVRSVAQPSPVTALAEGGGTVAVGLRDGRFRVYDTVGELRFERQLPAAISAVAVLETAPGEFRYFVGTQPPKPREGQGAAAPLFCLAADGRELWKQEVPAFQMRNGTVRTIFSACFRKGESFPTALVFGAENWKYYAYTFDGEKLWERQVYHGATAGAAGDFDGDGLDEVFAGSEYPYAPILRADGKTATDRITTPWTSAVALTDLDDDGKVEAVIGRSSHALEIHRIPRNGKKPEGASIMLGGYPESIVSFRSPAGGRIAVAGHDGRLLLLDGALQKVSEWKSSAPLRGLAVRGEHLLVLSDDGYVYELDGQCVPLRKFPLPFSDASPDFPAPTPSAAARNMQLIFPRF